MSKPVHLLETLVLKRCTGLDTSVHLQTVPKLVHGECTSLETLGNYKLLLCDHDVQHDNYIFLSLKLLLLMGNHFC